ncbi:MAG TPA: universal stress protein [Solirubrobacteraceae bacterium]|jgi:APA family basic amino acid/polyamine antiporter|nr:universal stress protein [Solirubrobacteraceae bacterium]
MARLRRHGLQRVLGVNALFSTAYGNVGSSIYYALGLVASYALGLTPVVFVISGAIFYLTAATYAEATAMYPEAGGSSSFARHAFNEGWSFFAAWAQMLNYVITIAISAFFVPHYLGGLFWGALRHGPGDVFFGMGVIIFLSLLNVVGVKEAARLNIALAITDFGTQLLLVIIGIALVLSPHTLVDNVHFGVAPSLRNLLVAIPVCMIAYTGIETISNMAEEAKDESRTVPRAIKRVVGAVFIIYAALPVVALSALPVTRVHGRYSTLLGVDESKGGYSGDPVLGIVKHLHLGSLQRPAEIYVGLLAATILFIAANAGIIGVSRLVYSMGLHRQVPDRLRELHPRFNTPWIGILLFGAVACLTLIPGQATFLGNVYAFGAMLSFTIAHLAVIRLRVKEPAHERPYRGPGVLRVAGRQLPLFAIVGGLGTALAFVTVTALHLSVALFGCGWLALGMLIYVAFRRRQGLDLTTTVRVETPASVIEHEVEYQSILLVYEKQEFEEEALRTSIRLASHGKRNIHVLVLVEVPASLPITAPLAEHQQAALSVIETARIKGGRRIDGHVELTRSGQGGRRVVEYARAIHAAAIVMPVAARRGAAPFSHTIQTVLQERPCRVIVTSAPVTKGASKLTAVPAEGRA